MFYKFLKRSITALCFVLSLQQQKTCDFLFFKFDEIIPFSDWKKYFESLSNHRSFFANYSKSFNFQAIVFWKLWPTSNFLSNVKLLPAPIYVLKKFFRYVGTFSLFVPFLKLAVKTYFYCIVKPAQHFLKIYTGLLVRAWKNRR